MNEFLHAGVTAGLFLAACAFIACGIWGMSSTRWGYRVLGFFAIIPVGVTLFMAVGLRMASVMLK